MEQLIFLYLLAFPFGQLGRFEVTAGVAVHAVDVLVGFIGIAWILRWLGGKKRIHPPLARAFISFTVIASFSLIFASVRFSAEQIFIGSLYLARWIAYMLFYFAVWELVRKRDEFKKRLYDALIVVGGFIGGFGLLQYFLFPDTRGLLEYGWDEHYARLIGTFLDPGFTGILLVLFLILVLVRKWEQSRVGRAKFFLLFALGFLALALTYSRASYLSYLTGLTAIYIVRRNWRLAIGGTLLILATAFLLPRPGGEGVALSRTSTIFSRLESYQKALNTGLENPVLGVGFNLYRYADGDLISHSGAGSDSSLLFVFATTGVIGLSAYLALWWKILLLGWDRRMTTRGAVLVVATVVLLVHSFFNNSLFYPWVLGWMGILLAVQEE